jgi:hypothetical protein
VARECGAHRSLTDVVLVFFVSAGCLSELRSHHLSSITIQFYDRHQSTYRNCWSHRSSHRSQAWEEGLVDLNGLDKLMSELGRVQS